MLRCTESRCCRSGVVRRVASVVTSLILGGALSTRGLGFSSIGRMAAYNAMYGPSLAWALEQGQALAGFDVASL